MSIHALLAISLVTMAAASHPAMPTTWSTENSRPPLGEWDGQMVSLQKTQTLSNCACWQPSPLVNLTYTEPAPLTTSPPEFHSEEIYRDQVGGWWLLGKNPNGTTDYRAIFPEEATMGLSRIITAPEQSTRTYTVETIPEEMQRRYERLIVTHAGDFNMNAMLLSLRSLHSIEARQEFWDKWLESHTQPFFEAYLLITDRRSAEKKIDELQEQVVSTFELKPLDWRNIAGRKHNTLPNASY